MKTDLQELFGDREEMPAYDESIFEPEKAIKALGFTDEDIKDLCEFMRWHINQRERGIKMKVLIALLRAQLAQVRLNRKSNLIKELEWLEQISK